MTLSSILRSLGLKAPPHTPDATPMAAPNTAEAPPLVPAGAFAKLAEVVRDEFTEGQTFFVTGAGRSGTTSCIRILGTASNAATFTEPRPRFYADVRRSLRGEPVDVPALIWDARIEQIRATVGEGLIYGEKDQQVFCWLPFYRELFQGRFLLVRRDGRDVVRSLMDYHNKVNGNMYREAGGDEALTPEAQERLAVLPERAADTEFHRPRPVPGDPMFDRWPSLSRLQMIAWYWSLTSRTAQRDLYRMGPDAWTTIDYSHNATPEDFHRLFGFFGLEGFDGAAIDEMLTSRIGSLDAVARRTVDRMPPWSEWSDEETKQFDDVAASAMVELGYYPLDRYGWRIPIDDFMEWSDDGPRGAADPLHDAVWRRAAQDPGVARALTAGARARWIGAGVPPAELAACGCERESHRALLPKSSDLIVSLGVIDRCPEMDQYLVQLAAHTRDTLVIGASRGHFADRVDHRYGKANSIERAHEWANDWAPAVAQSLLTRAMGFAQVKVIGAPTGDPHRPFVSLLIASRTGTDSA